MGRINHNTTVISPAIRALGGTPNGDVWQAAKAVVSTDVEDVAVAIELLQADANFVQVLGGQPKTTKKSSTKGGFVREKIKNYQPVGKTRTWTRRDGSTIEVSEAQFARYLETAKDDLVAINTGQAVQTPTQVSQAPQPDKQALVKALSALLSQLQDA